MSNHANDELIADCDNISDTTILSGDIEDSYIQYIENSQINDFNVLKKFLMNSSLITKSGDPNTNIIEPMKASYKITGTNLVKFFKLIESCRRQNIILHYAEKQLDKSGIMIDLDIDHKCETCQVTYDNICNIVSNIVTELIESLKIDEDILTFYIGVIKCDKPRIKRKNNETFYRESIHILIPNIKISKQHKKYIIHKLIEKQSISSELGHINLLHIEDLIDKNSASVPVHFIGHCKIEEGKVPDQLYKIFKQKYNKNRGTRIESEIQESEYVDWNISHEFSLNYEGQVIHKAEYEPLNSVMQEMKDIDNTIYNSNPNELFNIQNELHIKRLNNPNIKIVHELLSTLSIDRARNYNDWNRVLYVLASQGEDYKILAQWFSQRCPEKWNAIDFENHWEQCIVKSRTNPYSIGAIYDWAKQDNPNRFKQVIINGTYHKLCEYAFIPGINAELGHYPIAKLLHSMLSNKYIVSTLPGARSPSWFEFVTPGDDCYTGQIYKYHILDYPDRIDIYISESIPSLLNHLRSKIQSQLEKAQSENKKTSLTYYKNIMKGIAKTMRNIQNATFKRQVINQAEKLFINYNFGKSVDNVDNVLGVGNGILMLEDKPYLITHHHTYPITMYTETMYKEYDPTNYTVIKLERILRDLFPEDEQDAYEFIMCHLSTCLDAKSVYAGYLVILLGEGSNGKSLLAELITGALGNEFSVKNASSKLLTDRISSPDKPNPAAMSLYKARAAFYDEFERNMPLQDYNLKMYVGGNVSARQLNCSQIVFQAKATSFAMSNHEIIVNTNDFGTWRRIYRYGFKMRFLYEQTDPNDTKDKYDKNNKYHRIRDDSILHEFAKSTEAKEAMLSILVKWYAILQNKYHGNLSNIPKPTIDKETRMFRQSQDRISQWINQRVVKCTEKNKDKTYDIQSFARAYSSWYDMNISRSDKLVQKDIISALTKKSSKLSELNCLAQTNDGQVVVGYRPLMEGSKPDEGEEYIHQLEKKKDVYNSQSFKSADHRLKLSDYYNLLNTELDQEYDKSINIPNIPNIPNTSPMTELETQVNETEMRSMLLETISNISYDMETLSEISNVSDVSDDESIASDHSISDIIDINDNIIDEYNQDDQED